MTAAHASAARMPAGEIVAVTTTTFTAQSYELNEVPPFGSLLRIANPWRPAGSRQDAGDSRGDDGGGQAPLARAHAPRVAAYYALCYGSQTGSIEPGRHAVAWGRFEDDEEDIYRRQPQLAHVLRTTFDALLVGYETEALGVSLSAQEVDGHEAPVRYGSNGYGPTDTLTVASSNGALLVTGGNGNGYPAVVQRVPAAPPRLHALVSRATSAETARFNDSLTYLRFVLRANLPLADDVIAAAIRHAYEACGYDETFLLDAARSVARLLGGEHERVMNILELLDD